VITLTRAGSVVWADEPTGGRGALSPVERRGWAAVRFALASGGARASSGATQRATISTTNPPSTPFNDKTLTPW